MPNINIDKINWDLTLNNPNYVEEIDNRSPKEIFKEIENLDDQLKKSLKRIKDLL